MQTKTLFECLMKTPKKCLVFINGCFQILYQKLSKSGVLGV